MNLALKILVFILFISQQTFADEASNWLKKEIDEILNAYKNENISNEVRFLMIEDTINYNFAGAGIAKFVAGDSWKLADKETKNQYISLFKRHLALNISSMMQGYSNQKYSLVKSDYSSKNKVSLIDMNILNDTGDLTITWRVKKSKERFFVIDLLVADISLVVTKRSEFNSMLKNVNNNLKDFNLLLQKQNDESYSKIIK
jgi:ABC-type transporter MlaC component